jgi:hypothetical protein
VFGRPTGVTGCHHGTRRCAVRICGLAVGLLTVKRSLIAPARGQFRRRLGADGSIGAFYVSTGRPDGPFHCLFLLLSYPCAFKQQKL